MSNDWTLQDIPDQTGRVAVVTGANSGIGLETARELARKGARVVLACRSEARANEALADIRAELPDAQAEFECLDLADLEQLPAFVAAFRERFDRLDLLINNAGVMVPPAGKTKQGFELQLGVNHLGHYALTGRLLDLLLATPGARVVNVSSTAHRGGRIDFDDLDFESRGYQAMRAYGQSKLANLLFTYELERRLDAADRDTLCAACHPGWAATNLQFQGARMDGSTLMERLADLGNRLFSQDAAMGSLPTLYAATAPDVEGGDYIGPNRMFETWGHPTRVGTSARARDEHDATRLWELSEELTGVRFAIA